MKSFSFFRYGICAAVILCCLASRAEVPMSVNVTGTLAGVDEQGRPVVLPQKHILFYVRLYSEPGEGDVGTEAKTRAIWGRQMTVGLHDGAFAFDLSDASGAPLDANGPTNTLTAALALARDAGVSALWVGLTPEDDNNDEIYPRQKVVSVPTALQARNIRRVDSSFSVTNGAFIIVEKANVEEALDVQGSASYAKANFASPPMFEGGVSVKGTLSAESLEAPSGVKVDTLEAMRLTVPNSLTVSNLTLSGDVRWNGALTADEMSLARVEAPAAMSVQNATVSDTLTVEHFNRGSLSLKQNGYTPLGTWKSVSDFAQGASSESCPFWYERNPDTNESNNKTKIEKVSVTRGSWTAPADCYVYAQAHTRDFSKSSGTYIYFWVSADSKASARTLGQPFAIAGIRNNYSSRGRTGVVDQPVPFLLRKGQSLIWLGFNANALETQQAEWADSKVTAIYYVPFND